MLFKRYSVHYLNGSIEQLTSDQFTLNNDGTQVTLSGLTVNQSSNVTVNVTLRKNDIKSKIKNFIRSEKLIVDKNTNLVAQLAYQNCFNNNSSDKQYR